VPDLKQFLLPDVGEGLTEADILTWSVAPGDRVVVNQTLVEVETAKAAVELPSPFAGVVAALHAAEGETVEVGRPIITIDTAPEDTVPQGTTAGGGVSQDGAFQSTQPAATATAPAAEAPREAVLVGYGPRSGPARRRVRRATSALAQTPTPTAQAAFAVGPSPAPQVPNADPMTTTGVPGVPTTTGVPTTGVATTGVALTNAASQPARIDAPVTSGNGAPRALAKPPVRKLAKSLGVDLDAITPTGPNGSVSRDDVERAVAGINGSAPAASGARQEREERIPIKGVRKHMAAAMVASAFTAPHVTEFVTADVTEMMELRGRLAARREFADVKLSPLALVARAALWAVARTPIVNSTWDDAAGEIVVKHYVNLGIAAATGRGLVVPNIKDADGLSLRQLAEALRDLAETARSGRTAPADMSGGTFTITNVGVFGVDTGTPIINPGESAILAFGAVKRAPWVVRRGDAETIEARWVTQLALSFDHRVVDGEQGSTFLADLAAVLTDPGLALT
jgi:2-oxoisovalerate dehydrogenase E2 component (dihydrolipoyl transacylase)